MGRLLLSTLLRKARPSSVTAERFHKPFDFNVLALLLVSQEAIKLIGPTGDSIIKVSSFAGPCLSDGFRIQRHKSGCGSHHPRAFEGTGFQKIRVNSLNPGMIETEGLHSLGFDFRKLVESETPLGRIAPPQDITSAAVFFASDDADWVPVKR
ncbi:MAG: SDR family oxidoreductase [Bryobacteraceae bacterium]